MDAPEFVQVLRWTAACLFMLLGVLAARRAGQAAVAVFLSAWGADAALNGTIPAPSPLAAVWVAAAVQLFLPIQGLVLLLAARQRASPALRTRCNFVLAGILAAVPFMLAAVAIGFSTVSLGGGRYIATPDFWASIAFGIPQLLGVSTALVVLNQAPVDPQEPFALHFRLGAFWCLTTTYTVVRQIIAGPANLALLLLQVISLLSVLYAIRGDLLAYLKPNRFGWSWRSLTALVLLGIVAVVGHEAPPWATLMGLAIAVIAAGFWLVPIISPNENLDPAPRLLRGRLAIAFLVTVASSNVGLALLADVQLPGFVLLYTHTMMAIILLLIGRSFAVVARSSWNPRVEASG